MGFEHLCQAYPKGSGARATLDNPLVDDLNARIWQAIQPVNEFGTER